VAVDATLPAVPRPFPLLRGLTTRVSLTAIVGVSFAARAVASAAHPVPRYFPDEYVYTAIARSLGAGHAPAVRGAPAHFPALLAPLLAAPFQALCSPELAYRLTQAENALLMSLAAVPVYLLARRLSLSARYALACAAFAVLVPDLVYASYTLSDPVGYPLALAAVAAAVAAVARPSRRAQVAFLALAALAVFARIQYVVIPAAFVVAAVAADRRRVLRAHRLPLAVLALPVAAALLVGASRALGYYSHVAHLHVGGSLLRWAATDVFLLALSTGVVLVPGAVVALARPRGREEAAFAAVAAVFAAGLVLEAALYASNGSDRFQERYLFALLPLVPVAFGLYLRHGRPSRVAVAALSLTLLAASARVPLSGYAAAVGKTDSPFLFAVFRLESLVGTANGALAVALLAGVGALAAVAVSRVGHGRLAVAGALGFVAVTSVGAVVNDASNAQQVRKDYLPRDLGWVDTAGVGPVTLVQTNGSPKDRAVEQLYWNRSITREVRLGDAQPTDVYPAPVLHVTRDGSLVGVGGSVLFQGYAATARFQNATVVARAGSFTLWSAESTPRLGLLEQGRFSDGWLMRSGRITVWPDATGRVRGTLKFMLTLPRSAQPVVIHFGKAAYQVAPGRLTIVTYTLDARGRWSLPFRTNGGHWLDDLRSVSVQSTPPVFDRAEMPESRSTTIS
jgi:hypothetical protein